MVKGDAVFPDDEIIHYRKPTEKEWREYVEHAIEMGWTDDLREFVKKHEGHKKWHNYVKWTNEVIENFEQRAGGLCILKTG